MLKYVLIEFFADSTVLFLYISNGKVSSSFTEPNEIQAKSENNFLASYMMEVEDDNVYIERMTTDVSGNSGLDGQSEKKFYGFTSMDALLLKYYELQIRILTSGRSDIEKINRKIHSDENRYVPICYYIKLSRDFCVKY